MSIEEQIKQGMARMIEKRLQIKNVTVTEYQEEFVKSYFTGCETCGYGGEDDRYKVEIFFTHPDMKTVRAFFDYDGTFAELIKELDSNV